jgi:H+-transporting ATPase
MEHDGKWITPEARELVPGDVIRVRLGDIVPADERFLEGEPVEADQSALIGESLPATRKSGEAVSRVRSSARAKSVHWSMPPARERLLRQDGATGAGGAHIQPFPTLGVEDRQLLEHPRSDPSGVDSGRRGRARRPRMLTTFQFALVLTVAAISVAMPRVLSVTMSVGARLLAKKEAIVSQLAAIGVLPGVAVLGDLKNDQPLKGYQVVHFQPFDPVHKRTEAAVKQAGGRTFKMTKGAPQVILELSEAGENGSTKGSNTLSWWRRRESN